MVLALISGTVAYIGDVVGRWVAKKRMSLFGVRPRRSGSVIAVFTGVIIALVSFGLLTLVSKDIRKWVYEYDKLTRDLTDLRAQYETMSQSNEALKASAERINNDLQESKTELDGVRGKLEETGEQLQSTGVKLDKSQSDLSQITGKLSANEKKLAETQVRLKTAGDKEQELTDELRNLEGENASLKQNREILVGDISKLQTERSELEAKTKELEAEEQMLSDSIFELEIRLGELKSKNILIGARQPLAYIAVESDWTGQQVREAIITTLGALRHKLASKGFTFEIARSEDMEALLAHLSLSNADSVIIIYSKENVVPERPVRVSFSAIPVELCFRKDEVIASFEVPSGSSSDFVEELFANAISSIRVKADEKNLLPDIDKGTVGSLNYEEIKRLVAKLAWSKEKYFVLFVVPADVYTLGNLDNLQIKARPVK